ncbi:MAG: methyltransferase domain-containing protein [Acidobacteriota bacterium]
MSTNPNATRSSELLDEGELSHQEVSRALEDLRRSNRWLLGYRILRQTLLPRLLAPEDPASSPADTASFPTRDDSPPWVLDVGCGLGDVSADLAQQAEAKGRPIRVVGLDAQLRHLLLGRREYPQQHRVVACARHLPFAEDAVSWSFSSLVFHHFDAVANDRILAEMRRVARRGAVIVDLRRSPWLRALIRPTLRLLGNGPVARHDGRLSVAASWSLKAVRQLAATHPILELRRRFPFRFSLVLDGRPTPSLDEDRPS